MTTTERAQALAQHTINTARAVAEHMAAMPPRALAVRVWRRRCRARLARRGPSRGRLRRSLHRARGYTAAHVVHAVQGMTMVIAAKVELDRLRNADLPSYHADRPVRVGVRV